MTRSFALFLTALLAGLLLLPQVSGQALEKKLDPALVAEVAELLDSHADPRPQHNDLWLATRTAHGHVDLLVRHLEGVVATEADAQRKLGARRLLAQVLRRDGMLSESLGALLKIDRPSMSTADHIFHGELLDALGRSEQALEVYNRLLKGELDADVRKLLLLRCALMQKKSTKALAEFVGGEGRTREQKNEASVILALQGDQKSAISNFEVQGEKTLRFRQEVRLAEWAIECKDFDKAQEWAWAAWKSAKMKRDQRYALTLIASAYRRDKAIPELLDRFAKMEDMSTDARQLWIRLLREEGKVDDALRLFREGDDAKFTAPMRRQLLEICRETGREDILIAAFEQLISAEPENLEWRSGLSRYRLENGDKENAVAVWDDFSEGSKPRDLITAAFTLVDVGLEGVAEKLARLASKSKGYEQSGLLFVFKLHLNGGNTAEATRVLEELSALAPEDGGLRAEIADGYERLGRPDLAVSTLEGLRTARGGFLGTDLEMKFAILLSKIGREEDALGIWRSLWVRLRTSPRARFVEDRMMTVASRLGVLAKIAIELEDRLATGKAGDQDVDLLVRLYIKVGDPASATEILEEYLKKSGTEDLEVTRRKAKIYLACHDYYNYEQLMQVLVDRDEDGRLDHLRELAMSQLERGRRDLAIGLLPTIREASGDNVEIADEFEAGIYGIVGLKNEALVAYLRGMGRHPERIDTYLLISNLLRETGDEMRAVRMFQYMAQTAERDDLFTIAIDGILNLRAPRDSNVPDEPVRWALRTTLERLARKPHRFYLYRLAADLAEELKDMPFAIRALKAGLPVAGERRTAIMREIMNKCHALDPGARQIFGSTAFNPSAKWDATEYVMVGRRLLGQGEHVPPSIFMNLATIFIRQKDIPAAMRTFSRAAELLEYSEVTREAARVLEDAGEIEPSLKFYRRLLATSPNDPSLLAKVGHLEEELGRGDDALARYERALELVFLRKPQFVTFQKQKPAADDPLAYLRRGNVDPDSELLSELIRDLLVNLEDRDRAREFLKGLGASIDEELAQMPASSDKLELRNHPRLLAKADTARRIALGFGLLTTSARQDNRLINAFPDDRSVIEAAIRDRRRLGYLASAQALLADSPFAEDRALQGVAGLTRPGDDSPISIAAASTRLTAMLARPTQEFRRFLDRIDTGNMSEADIQAIPSVMSACIIVGDRENGERMLRAGLRHVKSDNLANNSLAILMGLAKRLDQKMARAIFVEQAENRISAEPRAYYQIMQLEEALGGDLIDSETASRMLRNSARNADKDLGVGAAELLGRVNPEERPTLLRDIYDAYPASKRAVLLTQAVYFMEGKLDESFEDWYAGSLQRDVKTGDTMMVRLGIRPIRGGSSKPGPSLMLKVARALQSQMPSVTNIGVEIRALCELGQIDEALKIFEANVGKMMGPEYQARQARDATIEAFGGEHRDKLIAVIARVLKDDPGQKELVSFRWDLMRRSPDYGVKLIAAHNDDPKNIEILQKLVNYHTSQAHTAELAEALQKLMVLEPQNKRWKSRLIRTWKTLKNPLQEKALTASDKKETGEKSGRSSNRASSGVAIAIPLLRAATGSSVVIKRSTTASSGGKKPAGPAKDIQELIDAGKLEEARGKLRGAWRCFHVDTTSPYRSRFPQNLLLRYQGTVRVNTPGVVTIFGAIKNPPPFVAEEARLLLRMIAGLQDSVVAEIRRELLNVIVKATPQNERRAAHAALMKKAQRNEADSNELEVLLRVAAESKGDVPSLVLDLVERPEIPDGGRLALLAKVLARSGRSDHAVLLYRLGVLSGSSDDIFALNRANRAEKMVKEFEDVMGEQAKNSVLDLVDDLVLSSTSYDAGRVALSAVPIWEKRLSPRDAARRTKEVLPLLKSQFVGRMRQREKVPTIFARAGMLEEALQEVKYVICKDEMDARSISPTPRRIPKSYVTSLSPTEGEWIDRDSWVKLLVENALRWYEADEVLSPTVVFSVLAETAGQCGFTELAEQCVAVAQENAKGARDLVQLAGLLRRMEKKEKADRIEEQLLAARRLPVDQIAGVVKRIAERDKAAALAAAEKAAAYTLTIDLLQFLVLEHGVAGNSERQAHWQGILKEVRPPEKEGDSSETKGGEASEVKK